VLDEPWQNRDPAHWRTAAATKGRVMLAGGLGPENVRDAIAAVQPWAVDASSSLESEPGIKDHARVLAYVKAVNSGRRLDGARPGAEAPALPASERG
jgi:phosphoribosylanthranilate isomerase